jgi:uncharacterized membrane protein YphA (DoxX/SURF4 family)
MSVVASLLSIVLFLAFITSGAQKIQFNPYTSAIAQRLGFSKKAYQRLGVLEVVGGTAVLVGLASERGSLLGVINIVASSVLAVMMLAAVVFHLRKGDPIKSYAFASTLFVLAILQVVCRIA